MTADVHNIANATGNGTEIFPLFNWRLMFYLIHPSEIPDLDPKDVEKIPNYANQVIFVFMGMILIELAVKYYYTGKGFRINDSIVSMTAGIVSQSVKFLLRGVDLIVYVYIFDNWRLWTIPLKSWTGWILAALAADLAYYWLHRLNHEVSILWASHQTHHSSEEYNLTTALRQSAFGAIYAWIVYLPMAFFGFTPVAHLIHIQVNTLYQFYIHTTVIKSMGPLELILNTPSHHRVHHGRNRYCIDKNYAGALIIWDKMFGTFEPEHPDEPVVYGILTPIANFNGMWVQINYYTENIMKCMNYKTLKHKMMSLFMGPGWMPGTPRLGDPATLPDIKHPAMVYDVKISKWKSAYCVVHTLALLYFFDHCAQNYEQWDIPTVWIACACIFVTAGNLGSLLDDRWWIPVAEIARCGICWVLARKDFGFSERAVTVGEVLYALSGWFWVAALIFAAKNKKEIPMEKRRSLAEPAVAVLKTEKSD
ncbi:alkylglycerol monooxygenase-like [Paramacrobiotus metropolitanus]|uniref:alkylglycerol monooxygenase-like n=1 Tax=Paramacrobiotus metropolitanus TaxID=2943436 RepID=UPI002445A52B|nr:alkylglycerol monooxygenase-like [Paramacrobiotus metropolitanus]